MRSQPGFLAASLAIAACAGGDVPATTAWQSALDEVVATERAFAAMASDSSVQQAFLTYIDEAGILFRPGPVPARAELISAPMSPDLRLAWEPAFADASLDGTLGFTTGPWQAGPRSSPDSIGGQGQYLTVWRRTADGFRAMLDFGVTHESASEHAVMELAAPPVVPAPARADVGESLRIADEDLNAAITGDTAVRRAYAMPGIRWLRNGRAPWTGGSDLPAIDAGTRHAALGAVVAASGDLGYSWGAIHQGDSDEPSGYYVRVWRLETNGSWKVLADAAT